MNRLKMIFTILFFIQIMLAAQNPPSSVVAKPPEDYSGMYSFLKEGEFVQITVEEAGRLTGFVSRYGEQESDKGAFLVQFFKEAKLDGKKLTFTTQTVHGMWYEFKGTIERGDGKNPSDEGYYVLKGILTQQSTDAEKKTSAEPRQLVLKRFPLDMGRDEENPH